jgi:hypothetical protein
VGAIKSVVGELEKYKVDLVGVQEVMWEREGCFSSLRGRIFRT